MKQTLITRGPAVRRGILLALVFGIPTVFLRVLYDPINVPKLSLLVAGVSIVAALRVAEIAQGASWDGLRRLTLPAAAMGLPLLLAWAASPYKAWSLLGSYPRFGGLLPYLFAIGLGILLADAFEGRASEIAWALVAAGGVAGFYALIQFAGLDPFEWSIKGGPSDQTSSTLGNPNFTGGFLAIVAPVALCLTLVERRRRNLALVAAVLVIAALSASVSQGAWLAGLAGGTVLAGTLLASRAAVLRPLSLVVAGLVALTAIGTVAITIFADEAPVPQTAVRRAEWWQAAIAMGLEYPLFGRGPNAFAVEHARFRTAKDAAEVTSDITNDPHSVPLSFLSSAGLVGLVGFVVAMGWLVRLGLSVPPGSVLATGFFSSVVAYLVQALVSIDTVALRTSFWIVAGGLAAALAAAPQAKRATKKGSKSRRAAAAEPLRGLPILAGCVAFALLGLWGASRTLLADRSFLRGQQAYQDGDLNETLSQLETTMARRGDYFYRQSFGRDLGQAAAALADQGPETPAEDLFGRSRALFDYVEDFPDVGSILDYARVLRAWAGTQGLDSREAAEEALDLYTEAVVIDPKNALVVNEATEFARSRNGWDALATFLGPAARQLGDPNLWGTLALAHAHLDNEDEARAAIDEALRLSPDQGSALEAQVILDPPPPE